MNFLSGALFASMLFGVAYAAFIIAMASRKIGQRKGWW
jgi:hypothetical protein